MAKKQYKAFITGIQSFDKKVIRNGFESKTFKSRRNAWDWVRDLDLFDGSGGSFYASVRRVR